jgi:pyruvate/2-oxoglutarate dehydrogenase complex dihydrolipoamide acyltransferase (E2) component
MDLPNGIRRVEPVKGERAYMYGFKERARRHHCIGHGTFPVEVDRLESLRKEYSRRVRPITYLPLYVKATALAIERNPEANAVLFNGWFQRRIVHFERVDVNLPITRKVDGRLITFIGTVRNPAAKSLAQIQDELTTYQRCEPEESFAIRRYLRLARTPNWLIRLFHWRMTRDPEYYIQTAGTCGLTLVEGGNWYEHMFPIAPTSVVFGIGAARREPVVHGDRVEIARVLHCVLMADNYVIPGLLGARLAKDFKDLLEGGEFVTREINQAGEPARVI